MRRRSQVSLATVFTVCFGVALARSPRCRWITVGGVVSAL